MDVKDIKNQTKAATLNASRSNQSQASASSLTATQVSIDAVNLEVKSAQKRHDVETRTKRNDILLRINEAVETTEEIGSILESITGIVEQAKNQNLPGERIKPLEVEAQQLADQASTKLEKARGVITPVGVDDDTIKKIEKKLAAALEQLYPTDNSNIAAHDINFTTKEAIVNTLAKVESTRDRLLGLTRTVQETSEEIKRAVELTEVASENVEASSSLVRDLNQALDMASETSLKINEKPQLALDAIGDPSSVVELLK